MADITSYLDLARTGRREAALRGLIGPGAGSVPALREAFRTESDPAIRDVIVEAAWQVRSPGSVDLLAEALGDASPLVWRQALDGLTSLASSASLRVLEAARDRRVDDGEFANWVEQAIEDVTGRINE